MSMWATQIQSAMTPRPDVSVMNSTEPLDERRIRLQQDASEGQRKRKEATNESVLAVIQRRGECSNNDISEEINSHKNYINEVTRRLFEEGRINFRKGASNRKYWRLA